MGLMALNIYPSLENIFQLIAFWCVECYCLSFQRYSIYIFNTNMSVLYTLQYYIQMLQLRAELRYLKDLLVSV